MGTFQMKRTLFLVFALVCIAGASPAFSRDSLGMRLLGQTLLGPARQVVVQGNYAYVGVSCGLLILDVSDPANPVEMGRAYITTRIEDLAVQSGYAYVVDALEGLAVVDVREVRNPRMVGKTNFGFNMFGVAVKDTLAYVVGSGGMQDSSDFFVINVKDPAAPFMVAGYDTSWGEKIQLVDTLAYVAAGRLLVLSVANPLSVRKVAQHSSFGTVRDICIQDTFCYAVSQDSGLVILNIQDPLSPQKLGSCKPVGGPMRVSVRGNHAFLCEDLNVYSDYPMRNLSHMWVIDITDPTNPIQVGWYESPGSGGDVFAKDSLLYFADGGRGLRMMDVRVPSQPREITHYPTGDVCWELVKQGNYLYVAHGGDGLRVLDVCNPVQPVELGHLEMPWRTLDIVLKDTLLYAAEGDSGLVVVDIRNPAQPTIIGRWWWNSQAWRVYSVVVKDTFAYLSGPDVPSNLWIVNVADPRNPYYVGAWGTTTSTAYDLWVRGDYAYMVGVFNGGTQSFFVVDVSDPRNPYSVYQWAEPEPGKEAEGVDTLGYTIGGPGMLAITVANPVRPDTAGGYSRLAGDDNGYGLHYFAPGYVWAGWHTYYWRTGEHCGRMDLLDVRNPHPVQSIRHYESGWTISDVWGEDFQVAYGGAYLGNLLVFSVDSVLSGVSWESAVPLRVRGPELVISPNPVRGSCVIRFWSGIEGKVRLTLYDVTGRALRSFTPYALRLTPYEVYWDGRDDMGKEVRSGVYFLRAEFREKDITKKVVVVR